MTVSTGGHAPRVVVVYDDLWVRRGQAQALAGFLGAA